MDIKVVGVRTVPCQPDQVLGRDTLRSESAVELADHVEVRIRAPIHLLAKGVAA